MMDIPPPFTYETLCAKLDEHPDLVVSLQGVVGNADLWPNGSWRNALAQALQDVQSARSPIWWALYFHEISNDDLVKHAQALMSADRRDKARVSDYAPQMWKLFFYEPNSTTGALQRFIRKYL